MPENSIEPTHETLNFSAAMTGAGTFQLSDYLGKIIVLFFYPKDNTLGCTKENIAFRDAYATFQAHNTIIFGVSRDSLTSHEKFKTKLSLPFDLISDADEAICTRFQVIKMKNLYGKQVRGIERSTFIIDEHGKLVKEWRGVKVSSHLEEILDFLKQMA